MTGHPEETPKQRPDWAAVSHWCSLWVQEEGGRGAHCTQRQNCGVFSNRTFQLSLCVLSAWLHLVYFQILHSCQYPKLITRVQSHILDFGMVCLLRSSLCAWFSGEASGWKIWAAEDSCWEGQGATGQTRGMTPQHGEKHTGQVTKLIHTFINTSVS